MKAIGQTSNPYLAFALVLLALTGVSLYTAIGGILKAELFPMQVRALGVGLCYAVSNAIFGGSAEYAALWCKSSGREDLFFYYVTAMAGLVLLVALSMPDARKSGYLRGHGVE
jgi:MHS family alpha-ketoglutarate permease-like MFS transporter